MSENPKEAKATMREESRFSISSRDYAEAVADAVGSSSGAWNARVVQAGDVIILPPSAARLLAEALVKLADQIDGGA